MKKTGVIQTYLLNNENYQFCELLTITPVTGDLIRITNADIDIKYDPSGSNVTFYSSLVGFTRSNTTLTVGLEVDKLDLKLFNIDPNYEVISGVNLYQACVNGYFDNAEVLVERLFFPNYYGEGDPDYKVWIFTGNVCEANPLSHEIELSVNSALDKLNQPSPRNVYQASCVNTLYDAACGVDKTPYTQTATVLSDSTTSILYVNNLSGTARTANDWFKLGMLKFGVGNKNQFVYRSIKGSSYSSGVYTITLSSPLPYTPTVGVQVTLTSGCNKTYTGDCSSSKYNNQAKFRGFPDIPRNEYAR